MRGMMVPVFSFTILWIGISFRVYTVVKGDGTNEMKSELVYIQIIIIISSAFGWLDPVHFILITSHASSLSINPTYVILQKV